MEISFLFDAVSTFAVVFGVVFGLIQLRQYRLSRKREASLFLLNSYQTKEFIEGLWIIQRLPDGLSRDEIENKLANDLDLIGLVMSTWETIGILLFNHEVTIEMIDDAFSGPILFSWLKLEGYVHGLREELNRETLFEWFQWLSDRMKEREGLKTPVPAYIAYQDWDA
jgi:Domain of unknown function (DUF4760)